MRKLILTTAAVAAAIAGAFAAEPSFGTFTDTRDGQTYKTVKMPDGKTWMAQNINYQTESGSWCYEDKANNCKKYGRLYDWKTATTVCPNGWKLPSREDWKKLVVVAGGLEIAGKRLKARSGWNNDGNGTETYGFSALPGGFRNSGGDFYDASYDGYWWTATAYSDDYAYFRYMGSNYSRVDESYDDFKSYRKSYKYSVRCVKE
jgi:uncharacterized protein (TIGR02145 family)